MKTILQHANTYSKQMVYSFVLLSASHRFFKNIFLRIFPTYFQIVPAGIVHLLIVSHKLISSFSKINKKKLYKLKRFEIPKHHEKCVLLLCRHLFFSPLPSNTTLQMRRERKRWKKTFSRINYIVIYVFIIQQHEYKNVSAVSIGEEKTTTRFRINL